MQWRCLFVCQNAYCCRQWELIMSAIWAILTCFCTDANCAVSWLFLIIAPLNTVTYLLINISKDSNFSMIGNNLWLQKLSKKIAVAFHTVIGKKSKCAHLLYVRFILVWTFIINSLRFSPKGQKFCMFISHRFNPLMATLKLQSNGPLYSSTVIGTLAVDGCTVTFGTARRGPGGLEPRPVSSSLYQM